MATNPVVINGQNNVTYLPPNAKYTMAGDDELYVNSGFMWPEGLSIQAHSTSDIVRVGNMG
jgi:hypothetical protein